ncbi:SDR family oxidoreductase [Marivirga sp. S37H4]|uniref:SDR family oxidoreductase n=1 Tax=Marivirga aurantiaca TaxID=2802615 RepID=A0A934WY64_9BACT|nr:SDR family oxidoreductase [Marivirga aurantiaca]MBK6265319.1 SDR family oxidoreductase [Marivirga aurantiaca]
MNSKPKIAIVTGGSKGIGKSIALQLASEGTLVIIQYCKDKDQATDTLHNIQAAGGIAYLVQADFSKPEEAENFFEEKIDPITKEINKEDTHFDILVNNAGVFKEGDIHSVTADEFDFIFNVNAKSVLLLMKQAFSRINSGGRIINISSGASVQADSKSLLYGLSKSVIDNLTLALTAEYGKIGVTVNAIAPGPTETAMVKEFSNEMAKKFIGRKTALNRIGQPNDIAKVVSFLISENGEWVNGTRLEVNGGYNKI